jgi:PPP family 3-phenylpropionic acid transporter
VVSSTSVESETHSETSRSQIWKLGALQALKFGSGGLTVPFTNIYLLASGFNNAQIGTLISVSALAQLLLSPVLNTLADRTGSHRKLLYALTGITTLTIAAFIWPISVVWLGANLLIRTVADNTASPLLAQLTVTWIGQQGKAIYGRLRGLGSLGYALVSIASGLIFAHGGYPVLFLISAVIMGATLLLIGSLPARTAPKPESKQRVHVPHNTNLYLLAAAVFLFYVGNSAFAGFSFIFYQKVLGASNDMIGIVSALTGLAELPGMLLIDWLIKRWDARRMLLLGIIGMAVLWLTVSQMQSLALLIPLLFLRGLCFACQLVSLTLLIAEISPPEIAATNQAIVQVTVPGVATLLTGAISGWVFDHLGGRVLFGGIAGLGVISALLLILIRGRLRPYVPPSELVPIGEPEVA